MMSKTHIAIGAATALVGTAPMTPGECAIAVIGGVIGGIVADNDILDNDYLGDALFGQICAAGITALILFIDFVLGSGIVKSMLESRALLITGIVIFAIFILCRDNTTTSWIYTFCSCNDVVFACCRNYV